MHHPVPQSRGGKLTVPLCPACHALAHHSDRNMNFSTLIKEALHRKKVRGERLGRPAYGTRLNDESGDLMPSADFVNVERVMQLRSKNLSFVKISDIMEVECATDSWSHTKVRRIVRRWKSLRKVKEFRSKNELYVQSEEERREQLRENLRQQLRDLG